MINLNNPVCCSSLFTYVNWDFQRILDHCSAWAFNAFTLETVAGGRSLPVLCVHLFHWYGLLDHFQLDVVCVWKLFSKSKRFKLVKALLIWRTLAQSSSYRGGIPQHESLSQFDSCDWCNSSNALFSSGRKGRRSKKCWFGGVELQISDKAALDSTRNNGITDWSCRPRSRSSWSEPTFSHHHLESSRHSVSGAYNANFSNAQFLILLTKLSFPEYVGIRKSPLEIGCRLSLGEWSSRTNPTLQRRAGAANKGSHLGHWYQ